MRQGDTSDAQWKLIVSRCCSRQKRGDEVERPPAYVRRHPVWGAADRRCPVA